MGRPAASEPAARVSAPDHGYQYAEEYTEGTLASGKLTNVVMLDRDPTMVEPATIVDTRVIQTIEADRTVYEAP